MNRSGFRKTVSDARSEILFFRRHYCFSTKPEAETIKELELQITDKSNDELLTVDESTLYWRLFDFIEVRLNEEWAKREA